MSIEQKLCKVKVKISSAIYVECDKIYQSKVCVQEFLYLVSASHAAASGLDIQLEKSKYNSPVCKKIGCMWGNTTRHILFFLGNWYEQMALVKVSSSEFSSEFGNLGSIPDEWHWVLKHSWVCHGSHALAIFCVALSQTVHWPLRFLYCCTPFNFFFLDFVSCDLVLTEL